MYPQTDSICKEFKQKYFPNPSPIYNIQNAHVEAQQPPITELRLHTSIPC